MIEVARAATVAGPAQEVWNRLADFGAISAWAPNADHSCRLGPAGDGGSRGVGQARRVQTGTTTLVERVTTWDEPKTLTYAIEGLPAVVRFLENEWRLEPQGEAATHVTLTTRIDCGSRPPQRLLARVLGLRLARESDSLLAGLSHACLEEPTHA